MGVTKIVFEPTRKAHTTTHLYVKQFENAVLEAQAVVRVLEQLKARNFVPDLVCAHIWLGLRHVCQRYFSQYAVTALLRMVYAL